MSNILLRCLRLALKILPYMVLVSLISDWLLNHQLHFIRDVLATTFTFSLTVGAFIIYVFYPDLRRLFLPTVPTHPSRLAPPQNAAFLFYLFLDAQNCDALVGDLEERYRLIHKKFGARRADFWYWTQAIRSVGPIAWAAMKRLVKAISGIAALVELYRRIRS